MTLALSITIFLAFSIFGLCAWRWNDARIDQAVWDELTRMAEKAPIAFDQKLVEGLPEPAQRFFRYAIAAGTPLQSVAEITTGGELGFGTKGAPNYKPMQATQVLAAPHGLVWRLKSGAISGSDGVIGGTSWTRFWLFGLIPVVRTGGTADHHRSAMGRVIAEAVFWTPAALLPSATVQWETVSKNSARVTVRAGSFPHVVDVTIAEDGQPTRVILQRWSNENAEKRYRLQPFGGELSSFHSFGGYCLPTRVEGGNLIGTDAYFPFYKANVTAIRYVSGSTQR